MDLKDQGNAQFSQGNWQKAADLYTQALLRDPHLVPAYSNRAASWIHLERWDLGLMDTEQALDILDNDSSNQQSLRVKILWRKSVCERNLGINSLATIEAGLSIEPQNTKLLEEKAIAEKEFPATTIKQEKPFEKVLDNTPAIPIAIADTLPEKYRVRARAPQPTQASQPKKATGKFLAPPQPLTYAGVVQGTRVANEEAYDYWYTVDPTSIEKALGKVGIEPETLEYFVKLVIHKGGETGDRLLKSISSLPRYSTAKFMLDSHLADQVNLP